MEPKGAIYRALWASQLSVSTGDLHQVSPPGGILFGLGWLEGKGGDAFTSGKASDYSGGGDTFHARLTPRKGGIVEFGGGCCLYVPFFAATPPSHFL